jgi:hypothetical protein
MKGLFVKSTTDGRRRGIAVIVKAAVSNYVADDPSGLDDVRVLVLVEQHEPLRHQKRPFVSRRSALEN